MKKKAFVLIAVLVLCLGLAVPSTAANVFLFAEKSITLYEGESVQTEIRRDGNYGGEADIEYTSGKENVATVSADGLVTAVSKGEATITAALIRDGKRVGRTQCTIKVLRAVTKVTLNTTKLSVYDPDDPAVTGLLREDSPWPVLVVPAGTTVSLSATCTPEDASSRSVSYTTTDAGVARIAGGKSLKAIQRGECDLTVASVQDPQISETFRVLVIQPVKKIKVNAADKAVAVGSSLQLSAVCSPDNASIQNVTWSSRNETLAVVDENGLVTGLKKGSNVTIVAAATDGSGVTGVLALNVTQPVSSVSITQPVIEAVAGKRAVQVKTTVLPADANDKTLRWVSSDETVATVRNGQVSGHKAGICTVTCISNSNPEVSASVEVNVSQEVTRIDCVTPQDQQSLLVGESRQLWWDVLPADATNKALTFKSMDTKVATVDANGLVTAVGRGTVTITATAADGSRTTGRVKITVIQPVTGVSIQQDIYYVQRGFTSSIRAIIEPRNANNQRVMWSSGDEGIVTARSNGTSTGAVYGVANGTTTVTAVTEDGGFTASTRVRVGNFNEAVLIEELEVDSGDNIRISLRNMSQELTLENIHYRVECFDVEGNPMICNTDGISTFFEGDYPYLLPPLERTAHGAFRFQHYIIEEELGSVALTILSWRDEDGYTWVIPEDQQITTRWTRYNPYPYVTPTPNPYPYVTPTVDPYPSVNPNPFQNPYQNTTQTAVPADYGEGVG